MAELRKLPRVELVSVLESAGNGRSLYQPAVTGMQWRYGAVGNARWTGVRLADVLRKAGLRASAKEILFNGADVPWGLCRTSCAPCRSPRPCIPTRCWRTK
jgi:DMSO/TMAO reductase YedYZ molybdopterin-dependent catalytic subunit